jgi:cytochrome c-type biogenesis protein CcmH/NrfG
MESAQGLAMQTLSEGGKTDEERIIYAFRRCLARKPTNDEAQDLLHFLSKQTQHVAEGWIAAWSLAAKDPEHPPRLPAGATPTQLASWTAVARVLLNLDETITKE